MVLAEDLFASCFLCASPYLANNLESRPVRSPSMLCAFIEQFNVRHARVTALHHGIDVNKV